ncbi:hypothetical protein ACIA49_39075 [Kribbella sp. NPDC051587]|uniref:hypothetical protein n=1 Tax=Kribbella sp. NPDC051587 TaxID=3364119 RepID=UPI0037966111
MRAWVHPDEVEKADKFATRAGISRGVYVDLLLEHAQAEVDEDGYPTWFPVHLRQPEPPQELPLTG